MLISITQQDIDFGQRGSCSRCPIAIAIRRKIPRAGAIAVSPYSIRWVHDDVWWDAYVPSEVKEFITKFDAYCPVEPMEFELCV